MSKIIAYDRVSDVPSFISKLGNSIAKSQMFGCGSIEAGEVLAMECLARKMPPLMIAERYNLIHGRLSMKSETMLADFRTKAGGNHRLVERSPDRVAIELATKDGEKFEFSLTWEEAKKEPFVYEGKESQTLAMLAKGETPPIKSKYQTPRSRMQMLWARLVSDSIRAVAPEIVSGSYTPEEVSDFDGVDYQPEPAEAEPIEEAEVVPAITNETVIDTTPVVEQPADERTEASVDDPCSENMVNRIKAAIMEGQQVGLDDLADKVKAKLVESGLSRLADLSMQEAEILLEAIETKNVRAFFDHDLKGAKPF